MEMKQSKFHLSLPCRDVNATRKFYENELGFPVGRSTYSWFDLNLYGNQITFTLDENYKITARNYTFDDTVLPSFHFGVILPNVEWEALLTKLSNEDYFAIGTKHFLEEKTGHHKSFFIKDPNDYFIEFKTFVVDSEIFESEESIANRNYG